MREECFLSITSCKQYSSSPFGDALYIWHNALYIVNAQQLVVELLEKKAKRGKESEEERNKNNRKGINKM